MAATATETAPTPSVSRDPALVSALAARNDTFTTLLSLIPQQYYVQPTQEEADSRWMKNKKRKTGEEIKEHKRKVKQEKLDPDNLPGAAVETETEEAVVAELPPALPAYSALPPAASISDLRSRMRSKLESFQKNRNFDPNSRDALEAARRQKRGEMRDKRRKERKEERRKAREEVTAKPAKNQLLVPQLPRETGEDITLPAVALPSAARGKAPLKKLSNAAQALAHLEKHNAKLAALPEEKRKEAEQRELWAKAEERARGGKVADEATVLKKAVKREEKRKLKSGQAWAERKRELEASQQASIKKRNDNIAARLQARRDKKSGKSAKDKAAAKKGKGRPGFEGKKKRA
ncbi:establishment of cell polarity protein [Trichosporon asahii var. asahii CBS 8904]|uniref:Establishment of cell polarity protein n=1 Tax=Trichosporon asahii var. asahii (strain CBS 8904) TaxID=1220162 RepID=K1WLN6_TRIAC|nr:establishment of cell polarity protein [Trichosporon asahii var. asahii CBS 8904]